MRHLARSLKKATWFWSAPLILLAAAFVWYPQEELLTFHPTGAPAVHSAVVGASKLYPFTVTGAAAVGRGIARHANSASAGTPSWMPVFVGGCPKAGCCGHGRSLSCSRIDGG